MNALAYWLLLPLAAIGWIAVVFLAMHLCPQERHVALDTAGEDINAPAP